MTIKSSTLRSTTQVSFNRPHRAPWLNAIVFVGLLGVVAFAPPLQAQNCEPDVGGVISWWPAEGSGIDVRGGNDGTPQLGASFAPGQVGLGFSLDGVDDYINVGDQNSLDFGTSQDFSIHAWMKSAGSASTQNVFDKRETGSSQGYLMSLLTSGVMRVFVGSNSGNIQFTGSTLVNDGGFHHVAVTFDRDGDATIYVDGVADVSASMAPVGDISNPGTFTIGRGNLNNPPSTHRAFHGIIDELIVHDRVLSAAEVSSIHSAGSAGMCQGKIVSGTVSSDCGGPLAGVTVDLDLDPMNAGGEIRTTVTSPTGDYEFADVPISAIDADLSVLVPLGYAPLVPVDGHVALTIDGDKQVDFSLACLEPIGETRGMGYWKHQAKAHLKGKGNAQESYADMATTYPQLLFDHFHENQLSAIEVLGVTYVSGPSPMDLATIGATLSARKNATMLDRAKQHYLALLLNTASGRLLTASVISADGATASQAIQHIATLINNGDTADDEEAKDIAETINNSELVSAGLIDLGLQNIAYSNRFRPQFSVSPNPGLNGRHIFAFTLPTRSDVSVAIYDLAGRQVALAVDGVLEPGLHRLAWDGRGSHGEALGSGIYFARLATPLGTQTIKVIRMSR